MKKKLKVMDSSGDTVVEFDTESAEKQAEDAARELFDRLTKRGAAVFAVGAGTEQAKRVRDFSELGAENVVVPAIVGG